MFFQRPTLLSTNIPISSRVGRFATVLCLLCCGFEHSNCDAGLMGGLTNLTNLASEQKFTVDFEIAAFDGPNFNTIGSKLDYVELDIVGSKVNSTPLGATSLGATYPYSRVDFSPTGVFSSWDEDADTQNFDTLTDFESRVVFEGFGPPGAMPYEMPNTAPFVFGTFTFDYSGLNVGDVIRLDIRGNLPPGQTIYTTSGVVSSATSGATQAVNFHFGTLGESFVEFTVTSGGGGTVIPEPGSGLIFLSLAGMTLATFHRHRTQRDV